MAGIKSDVFSLNTNYKAQFAIFFFKFVILVFIIVSHRLGVVAFVVLLDVAEGVC